MTCNECGYEAPSKAEFCACGACLDCCDCEFYDDEVKWGADELGEEEDGNDDDD